MVLGKFFIHAEKKNEVRLLPHTSQNHLQLKTKMWKGKTIKYFKNSISLWSQVQKYLLQNDKRINKFDNSLVRNLFSTKDTKKGVKSQELVEFIYNIQLKNHIANGWIENGKNHWIGP